MLKASLVPSLKARFTPVILTPLVSLAVILTGLSGCSVGSGANAPLTLHIWYSTDDPVERGWSQQMATRFNRTHHDFKVNLTDYAFQDINAKLQLALSSGHPPDLAYTTPRVCGIPIYVQDHRLLNLTPYARRYGWPGKLRRGLLQDYNSPFALYAIHKLGVKPRNVPVYAVPDAVAAVGIMYNDRILHRLHLRLPRTLHQFVHELDVAKAAGYTPIAMGNADGWMGDDWYQTLVNTRYPYTDLERELRLVPSFPFKRRGFQKMAGVLQSWAVGGDLTRNFGGMDAQDGVTTFFKGKSLFELVSSSEDSQILSDQRQTKLPIGIFSFPTSVPRPGGVMPQSGYEGWIVPKAAAHKLQAVQFINWLFKGSTVHFLIDHGVLPAKRVAASEAKNPWQRSYLRQLNRSSPGVYLDAAPVPSLNATMEANIQLLLHSIEPPSTLPATMQLVYSSDGKRGASNQQIDCEF